MTRSENRTATFAAAAMALLLIGDASAAEPVLTLPFDFSRSAIGLDVTVKGRPLYVILDTGVDPSAIDLKRADALGLPVQRGAGGEASGEGDAAQAVAYPSTINDLVLGGRTFAAVEAVAIDMSTLSARYGRPLDGVLGYSFLTGKIVLIDYPHATLSILARAGEARNLTGSCRKHYTIALRSYAGDSIPVIPAFRLGFATAPVTLDTGSTGGISLYTGAFALPGVREAFTVTGKATSTGARGDTTSDSGVLNVSVGFGPFTLPAGESTTMRKVVGSPDTRLGNIGNKLFAAMKLKMLLDYKTKTITFYGDCR